ncbi:NAD(+)/NADH kinase [Agathobaculum sp.]|uniref:NAD(+)/NADH kinase n=1 Tax=Agathobaculum sp. TaxID=2048138 RepID=UPI001F988C22|nr:NAD(+)/NADH kinase [Candidatus Agathobaculum intestinigallinarum]
MFMKSFFIYPNMRKGDAVALVPQVCARLRRDGVRLILPMQMRAAAPEVPGADYMETDEAIRVADAAVVLGGDGTMLRIARAAAQNDVPLLGVNVGHVGFMTELEPGELGEMEKLFDGYSSIDSRMMLHVSVIRNQRVVYENDALNDIVIAKGTAFRVVRVCISADDEEVTSFNGDGVIVATPTGSTAYGLSAGGPVIEPSAENMAVIPICAHALTAKSFVFSPERRIMLTASCEGGSEVFVSADGGQSFAVRPDDRVIITRSPLRTRLVRLKGISFYKILQQKL